MKIFIYKMLYKSLDIFDKYYQWYLSEKASAKNKLILSKLPKRGKGIRLNGEIFITDPSKVEIGNNVHIGNNVYINSDGGLYIGDNTHISRNVTIYTTNHNYKGKRLPYDETLISKPVSIGRNVWIGMNVSIRPGVTIGEGAIIGIGTVVTENIPDLSIVIPQPPRIITKRNADHYFKLEREKQYGGPSGFPLKLNDGIEE